jgi:NADH-quinone oxidoreductase subunit G
VPELSVDASTGAIVLEPRKCIKCARCIMVCQQKQNVWALSFLDRGLETRMAPAGDIELGDSPCIRCGQCSAHCPTGAIFEYDHTPEVWRLLRDDTLHCIAQIAPAVRVSVGETLGYEPGTNLTRKLYAALRRMGFKTIFDTNVGADVTVMDEATEFVHRLKDGAGPLPLITSCCPSWVDFLEKFHGDLIPHFSTCKSPHEVLGTLAKTYYADRLGLPLERTKVISLMPCTSKKYEIQRSREMYASGVQDVDFSVTTREVGRMIRQAGIELGDLPNEDADQPLGAYSGAGTLFGSTGGVMEAVLRTAQYLLTGRNLGIVELDPVRGLEGVKEAQVEVDGKPLRLAVAHGMANVEQVLDKIRAAERAGSEPPYHVVEVMACPGGCIGGGGQSWGVTDAVRTKRARGLQGDDRTCSVRRAHESPSVQQVYESFLGEPGGQTAHRLLHTAYRSRPEYRR